MNKDEQLNDLGVQISIKTERIKFLLENIIDKAQCGVEAQVFAAIALDENNEITEMTEKIEEFIKQ